MPEGPEVMLMSEELDKKCTGSFCQNLKINSQSRYFKSPFKGYSRELWIAQNELIYFSIGKCILRVTNRGKKILFHFEDFCFVSSLGLEGHWSWKEEKHSGIVLQFDDFNLYYTDTRHFGEFGIFTYCQLPEVLKNVGPEYLKNEVTFELFHQRLTSSKYASKEIVWFLMKQEIFSGCGNYVKADALFRARISPYRKIGSLSTEEIFLIYSAVMETLQDSYNHQGLSIRTYRKMDGLKGTYSHCCYNQKESPEGYPILKNTLSDKRTTYWCPMLQK
jgi:formamidopyrimidine-DNA glycosylase